jgi:hypothetical protein
VAERSARGLLAALLWLLAGGACAADLWDRIGPTRIGATREELALPMACRAVEKEQVCALGTGAGETFAGASVRGVELQFVQEQLARVAVTFSERYYSALLSFLGVRLGASDDRTFHARGGMAAAEFEAGVHLWKHDGVSLVLEQFAGKIDRSMLTYGSAPAMAELVRSKTSYPRGAHRDL